MKKSTAAGVRTVAVFEALKGALVLAAGMAYALWVEHANLERR